VATVFTFHTGKAIVQITAIKIAIDHLLDIGPPEAVLPREIFVRYYLLDFQILSIIQ
jgi:hypothetical protein